MGQPLVSIGAINYNNSKYLIETLESIKKQTYEAIELIIVDDCSTDKSVQLIDQWLLNYDKPVKFIKHKKNLGVCATCNDALKNATGKYFSLIATDDVMLPEKLNVQVSILENSLNDVAAVYSDAYLLKEDSSPRYGWFIGRTRDFEELPSGDIYVTLLEGNFIPAMSLLIKRKCLEEIGYFDETLKYEDFDMWLRLSAKYKILLSDYVSVKYRLRSNSLVHTVKSWNKDNIAIYAKHLGKSQIALKKMEHFVWMAYIENEKEIFEKLVPLQNHSLFLQKLLLYWKLKLPRPIAYRLLEKIKQF